MQKTLVKAGYHTVNLDYPSARKSIEELAVDYIPPAIRKCNGYRPAKIHFVTHSLGGIIVRAALKDDKPVNLGGVVMLSPPNGGSEVADVLKDRWYYLLLNGPAGQQLSTAVDSLPNRLGPVDYPVGIIAGDRYAFYDWWFSRFFHGANDGKVSVESTRLEGMVDFMIVHNSHSFIMNSERVRRETVYFLQHGCFSHGITDNN